jgi:uncharacterized damage-inducible protein DinB
VAAGTTRVAENFNARSAEMFETTLIELLHGKGSHADPIACIEDLSAGQASRTIENFPHSIYQLVTHMNYWMDYELHRIAGAPQPYPEHASASWLTNAAPPSESHWPQAVTQFRDRIARFTDLANSGAQSLSREIAPASKQQSQHSSTAGAILWQIVAHNSYHAGQIALIRRVLNAWPPKAGGDTW